MKCGVFFYLSNSNKELFPHQLRDEGVVLQVLRILKDMVFGSEKLRIDDFLEFLNWSFPNSTVDESLPEFKALKLTKKDLLLLCTRPPCDDERAEQKKPDYHSKTELEALLIKALRKVFFLCSRSSVVVQHDLRKTFSEGYKNRSDVEFYSRRIKDDHGHFLGDASFQKLNGQADQVLGARPTALKRMEVNLLEAKDKERMAKSEWSKAKKSKQVPSVLSAKADAWEKAKDGVKKAEFDLADTMKRTSAGYIVYLPMRKCLPQEPDFPGLLCIFSQSGTLSLLWAFCLGHYLGSTKYCDSGFENLFEQIFENPEQGYFAMAEITIENGIPERTSSFTDCLDKMGWHMKFIAAGPI